MRNHGIFWQKCHASQAVQADRLLLSPEKKVSVGLSSHTATSPSVVDQQAGHFSTTIPQKLCPVNGMLPSSHYFLYLVLYKFILTAIFKYTGITHLVPYVSDRKVDLAKAENRAERTSKSPLKTQCTGHSDDDHEHGGGAVADEQAGLFGVPCPGGLSQRRPGSTRGYPSLLFSPLSRLTPKD